MDDFYYEILGLSMYDDLIEQQREELAFVEARPKKPKFALICILAILALIMEIIK